ncbi:MAG: response regulator [Deltaproteobacteria bacterium]|nr:response regulator [Deltaproteobacteria bacterium]
MGKKVLLIDDEQDLTELLKTLLEFHDLDADTCNDSRQVEQAFLSAQYNLVVTDLMMPEIDGFQLIQKIREKENYRTVPIIALSAKTLTDEERKFLLRNNIHFSIKPFEPQDLVEQISQLLQSS